MDVLELLAKNDAVERNQRLYGDELRWVLCSMLSKEFNATRPSMLFGAEAYRRNEPMASPEQIKDNILRRLRGGV